MRVQPSPSVTVLEPDNSSILHGRACWANSHQAKCEITHRCGAYDVLKKISYVLTLAQFFSRETVNNPIAAAQNISEGQA